MNKLNEKFKRFSPCRKAVVWMSEQESPEKAWETCERGDWMLWIVKKLKVDDRKFTMAKAMCAKQVEHLMKDQRSRDAIQACVDYYNGKISRYELNAADADAADAAHAAAYAAAYAAHAAAYAAHAAAHAAAADAAAAAAAHAAAADAADADAAAAAKKESLKKSADICREYLTEEVLTKYKEF